MISTAVTTYWQELQPNINRVQPLQLLSTLLEELEQYQYLFYTFEKPMLHKKLSRSARTAVEWLQRMGYNWKEVKKGVYKDGHERPDMVQYPEDIFLKKLKELEFRMPYTIWNEIEEVIDIKLPSLSPSSNQVNCIPVTHDEWTCNAKDGPHHQ